MQVERAANARRPKLPAPLVWTSSPPPVRRRVGSSGVVLGAVAGRVGSSTSASTPGGVNPARRREGAYHTLAISLPPLPQDNCLLKPLHGTNTKHEKKRSDEMRFEGLCRKQPRARRLPRGSARNLPAIEIALLMAACASAVIQRTHTLSNCWILYLFK